MKTAAFQDRLGSLQHQRKLLMGLIGCLLLSQLLLIILLFSKHERILIQPAELTQSYWVEGNQFAPSYLEQQALEVCHLLLDVSPASAILQGEVLMRRVKPEAYAAFKERLLTDVEQLQKQQASLHFVPQSVQVQPETLTVTVQGMLCSYVGDKRVSETPETYQVVFSAQKSRLWVESFEVMNPKSEKKS